MAYKRPFIVLLPGGSQNPSHYAHLTHLLLLAGYPVFTAPLPSVGNPSKDATVADDTRYIRDRMLMPVLDYEERDVILLMHSYSGVPGSAAAKGLEKAERVKNGKKTGVIGQIYIVALLKKGGDGEDLMSAFGGEYPPHLRPDPEANLIHCDDRIPPLYQDVVPAELADSAAASCMAQGMTAFSSPCPPASWDGDEYKGRLAYVRTVNDVGVPVAVQQMIIDGTGAEWIVRDIESGHSPQLSHPEKLTEILLELAKCFEEMAQ